jgi:hypothetical protein
MAANLTTTDYKGFKKRCTSSAVDGTNVDILRNDSEEDGNVRNECEEDEGTDCEHGASDTVLCIQCMKLIAKYFFLAYVSFLGGRLRSG